MTTRKWIAGSAVGMIALAFASTGVGLFQSDGPATAQAMAQAPAGKPDKPAAPDDAKQEKIKEQLSQLRALDSTEEQLRQRIDALNAKIAKEQVGKDAEVSPRALMQAIDKIDQSILEEEAKLPELAARLEGLKKELRPDKDYPTENYAKFDVNRVDLRVRGSSSLPDSINPAKVRAIPEFANYTKALADFSTEIDKIPRDSKEALEVQVRRQKYIDNYQKEIAPIVEKKILALLQDYQHSQLELVVNGALHDFNIAEAFPKTVAKRRAELVDRLRKASGVSEEQKLLEDEQQVLREFRKAVLKQKLTLKLEMDGVKLPEEPRK